MAGMEFTCQAEFAVTSFSCRTREVSGIETRESFETTFGANFKALTCPEGSLRKQVATEGSSLIGKANC